MQPTLRAGDVLLVRYDELPRPGALALVRLPPDPDGVARPLSVKRVVGPATTDTGSPGWWVARDNPRVGVDSATPGVGALPLDCVVAVVRWRVPRRLR